MRAIMSDRARLQRMLDFEAALARAEAAVGVIAGHRRSEIGEACQADRYDIAALAQAAMSVRQSRHPAGQCADRRGRQAQQAGRRLRALGRHQPGRHRHRAGARTARRDRCAARRSRPRHQGLHSRWPAATAARVTVARTLLQQALPMPFGLKLAGYAAALARSRERLTRLRREALVLQFGGAAGTLAALGERGLGVAERLAALLDLPLPGRALAQPSRPTGRGRRGVCHPRRHLRQDRARRRADDADRGRRGLRAAQAGRGGSSTLPHKRNPIGAAAALSAAAIAPNLVATILAAQVQEHERAVGGWQTEWMTFPALALVTSGALRRRRRHRRRPGDRRRAHARRISNRAAARS